MFWAHSDPAGLGEHDVGSRWQPLAEHLANVSRLASELAKGAAPRNLAFHQMASMAGVLHDFGKYTACFQQITARAAAGVHTPSTVRSQRVNLACLTGKRLASGRFPSFARLRRITRASWTRISLSLRPDLRTRPATRRNNARSPKRSGAMH